MSHGLLPAGRMRLTPLLAALVLWVAPAAATATGIAGYWLTPTDHHHGAVIRIQAKANVYDGRIVALQQPNFAADADNGHAGQPKLDLHNPDPARRNDPIVGLKLVRGFEPDGRRQWDSGLIYNPRNGKTYNCTATLIDRGQRLKVRGYIGIALFGRTQIWRRVAGADYFQLSVGVRGSSTH